MQLHIILLWAKRQSLNEVVGGLHDETFPENSTQKTRNVHITG